MIQHDSFINLINRISDSQVLSYDFCAIKESITGHFSNNVVSLLQANGNEARTISQAKLYKTAKGASNFASKHSCISCRITDLFVCVSPIWGYELGDIILVETLQRSIDKANQLQNERNDKIKADRFQNLERSLRSALPYNALSNEGKDVYPKIIWQAIDENKGIPFCINALREYLPMPSEWPNSSESDSTGSETPYSPNLAKLESFEAIITDELRIETQLETIRNSEDSHVPCSDSPEFGQIGSEVASGEIQSNLGHSEGIEGNPTVNSLRTKKFLLCFNCGSIGLLDLIIKNDMCHCANCDMPVAKLGDMVDLLAIARIPLSGLMQAKSAIYNVELSPSEVTRLWETTEPIPLPDIRSLAANTNSLCKLVESHFDPEYTVVRCWQYDDTNYATVVSDLFGVGLTRYFTSLANNTIRITFVDKWNNAKSLSELSVNDRKLYRLFSDNKEMYQTAITNN